MLSQKKINKIEYAVYIQIFVELKESYRQENVHNNLTKFQK